MGFRRGGVATNCRLGWVLGAASNKMWRLGAASKLILVPSHRSNGLGSIPRVLKPLDLLDGEGNPVQFISDGNQLGNQLGSSFQLISSSHFVGHQIQSTKNPASVLLFPMALAKGTPTSSARPVLLLKHRLRELSPSPFPFMLRALLVLLFSYVRQHVSEWVDRVTRQCGLCCPQSGSTLNAGRCR